MWHAASRRKNACSCQMQAFEEHNLWRDWCLFLVLELHLKPHNSKTSKPIFYNLCTMSAGRMGLSNWFRFSIFRIEILVVPDFLLHFFNLPFHFLDFFLFLLVSNILSFICKKPNENPPWEPWDIGNITPTANIYKKNLVIWSLFRANVQSYFTAKVQVIWRAITIIFLHILWRHHNI